MRLYEREPAKIFEDAHLLGNGRLGATVYGGVPFEEILINDDTLWSGSESYRVNEGFYDNLMKARQLTMEGKLREAYDLINDEMDGTWGEAYMPLASAHVCVGQKSDRRYIDLFRVKNPQLYWPVSDYGRELDLDNAVETITYVRNGVSYKREFFVSYDRQLIYARFSAEGGPLDLGISLDSKLRHTIAIENGALMLRGVAPDHAEPEYTNVPTPLVYFEEEQSDSLRFAASTRVIATDGAVWTDRTRIYVNDASYAVLAIAAGTNYAGYAQPRDKDMAKLVSRMNAQLDNAGCWDCALKEHIADYKALYARFSLDLGEDVTADVPTTQRLALNAKGVFDPGVAALCVQYARYLTISGSRPGTQAANLQGIWNASTAPGWSSNYTTNINVEMNYWPAEQFNLSDCHEPMFDLVRECADSGKRAARDYYHLDGWVAHHNVDLWRMCVPACENASFFFWPFGGAWMAQHLWTHYEYTKDEKFLREVAYPVIREAARFMLGFLCENAEGNLTTAPSTSPENNHLVAGGRTFRDFLSEINPQNRFSANTNEVSPITQGSTMDLTMIRELFGNTLNGAEILGIKGDELNESIRAALARLQPYKISARGTLQEWYNDHEECTPGQDHMSHMYCVYPANIINERDYPEEFKAAYRSLQRRVAHGGQVCGWPGSWAISLGARFHDSTLCTNKLASATLGLGANLLTNPWAQIDAIFGYAAGVGEMLLQSHNGYIELLPTPAHGWTNGSYKGMKARGGFECDLEWKHNALSCGRIVSSVGGECRVKAKGLKCVKLPCGCEIAPGEDGIAVFDSVPGGEYTLVF